MPDPSAGPGETRGGSPAGDLAVGRASLTRQSEVPARYDVRVDRAGAGAHPAAVAGPRENPRGLYQVVPRRRRRRLPTQPGSPGWCRAPHTPQRPRLLRAPLAPALLPTTYEGVQSASQRSDQQTTGSNGSTAAGIVVGSGSSSSSSSR